MRITNNMKINMAMNSISAQNERIAELQEQLSSGKKVLKPSDDPLAASNSIKLNMQKNSFEVYSNNLSYAKNFISNSDTMADDANRALRRFKELAVRGLNGTLTTSDRSEIGKEMESLINQILSDANYNSGDGYIFSGSKTDKEPFLVIKRASSVTNADGVVTEDSITTVQYNGDLNDLYRNGNEYSKVKVNLNGEDAFMNVTGQSVYSAKKYGDINKSPFDDNLRDGYFTIKSRFGEELIKVSKDDSVQNIVDNINKNSKVAKAKIVEESNGSRIVLEARQKGAMNQFALVEGGISVPGTKTNALEILGLGSKMESVNKVDNETLPLSYSFKNMTSGSISVNGVYIKFDPAKDSLKDIIGRINDNVKSAYAYSDNGRLTIESTGTLSIADQSNSFAKILGIPENRMASSAKIPDSMVTPQPLSKNEWVKNGNFFLNGKVIGINDAASETLYTMKDKINSVPGINATASVENGRFVIKAGSPPDNFAVMSNATDGTSEFLKSFEFSYQSADLNSISAGVNENTNVTAAFGVTAGSEFSVNGATFKITAQDTIKTVIDRINSQNLGVFASLNNEGGQTRIDFAPSGLKDDVHLTSFKDIGGGDFLSKIRMGNQMASKTSVTAPLLQQSIGNMGVFGATSDMNGAFMVNGTMVEFNQKTDSLSDIVNKINSKVSGVNAYLNSNNQLVFDSTSPVSIFDSNIIAGKSLTPSPVNPKTATLQSVGVTGGDFKINGTAVNVTAGDTIDSFISKVNQQFDGSVRAEFDTSLNTVKFYNLKAGEKISMSAGTSNITSQAGLDLLVPNDAGSNVGRASFSNFIEKMAIKEEKLVDNNGKYEIKKSSQNAQSLFDILAEIRDNIYRGDWQSVSNNLTDVNSTENSFMGGMAKLDEAISHMANNREIFGNGLKQVENISRRNSDIGSYLDKLITENEGIDFERAVLEQNTASVIYQGALAVSAKINKQSLLDFLS